MKKKTGQLYPQGQFFLFVAIAAIGILSFTLISSFGNFTNSIDALLYPKSPSYAATNTTGNRAPTGVHYNLNIHGIAKNQSISNSGSNNIWAPLQGKCTIDLTATPATDTSNPFQVLQSSCLNNQHAQFELPDPTVARTGTYPYYSVWVRIPGNKGSGSLTSCYNETVSGVTSTYCNTGMTVQLPTKDGKFANVSENLLNVCVNGTTQPLFADNTYQYYWDYDNNGIRLAQMRFYPSTTATTGSPKSCVSATSAP